MPGVLYAKPDPLDVLEAQILDLEKKIIGDANFNERDTPLAESLVHSNNTINNEISSYSNIKTMFDRIQQLGNFLNPTYEDTLVNRMGKVRVVLESEVELRQLLDDLSRLDTLNNQLSPDPLKNIPSLYERLSVVTKNTIRLDEDFKEVNNKTKFLVNSFSSAVRTMNHCLLVFDAVLTEMERNDKVVKNDN
ncbi:uncharacterized protein LOC106673443 [Cimex lectularius]|uniref:Dynactin subunit 3 n=1 Tax=Cimex lectularius TaxID=79782 RepID=A0A8I6SUV6_CIMLE|nr:uncharacterized protein LOC106673443 [Cimex lectularius]XP_024084933.1 uncharacterized protein LOC106673443 [Cimex lectularius]XP_024084934.1 uncharacterized protein LOC106673443 [Cimex lectularius]XP_024084935.1 uncharacterized protein LOC106673443 [Cimex lectularius]XP_024084936.1 uncharacterized protein LOC106673443 [Cimex lectularius]XP_024084937.1 uncharacterized protein LOC106673443 [Cimex lectularius]